MIEIYGYLTLKHDLMCPVKSMSYAFSKFSLSNTRDSYGLADTAKVNLLKQIVKDREA